MDNLNWLTTYFGSLCDGEWESEYGITIESVNNPGWMVKIDLDGTGINPSAFKAMAQQRTATDWVECKVEEGVWLGGGGVGNLDEVIGLFRAFVEGKGGGTPGGQTRAGGGQGRMGGGDARMGGGDARMGGGPGQRFPQGPGGPGGQGGPGGTGGPQGGSRQNRPGR